MPLSTQEVTPGTVAFLDVSILTASSELRCSAAPKVLRNGPFLCVQVVEGESLWLHVIGSIGKKSLKRLELQDTWRSGGSGSWQTRAQYIHDERHTLIAPNSLFVAAAAAELSFQGERPQVSAEGIKMVLAQLEASSGTTL